jgi:hypothetical protein
MKLVVPRGLDGSSLAALMGITASATSRPRITVRNSSLKVITHETDEIIQHP